MREALRRFRQPPPPRAIILPENASGLPPDWQAEREVGLRIAAILVPMREHADGSLDVLLTERAAHLRQHAGQISFPGGAAEPHDADLAATALRESHEEVGLEPDQVDVLGYLAPQWTISNFAMTPVIGLLRGEISLRLQEEEVADAFWIPARHLFDAGQQTIARRRMGDIEFDTVELHWQGRRIWGATATVIRRLTQLLDGALG